jgi:hypothetical protein
MYHLLVKVLLILSVFANDIDPDGDVFTARIIETPKNGTLDFNTETGQFTYTPNENFSGKDTFTYRLTDSNGLESNIAMVTININNKPIAIDDDYVMKVNTTLVAGKNVTLTVVPEGTEASTTTHILGYSDILANDSDPERDPLLVKLITPPTYGVLNLQPDGEFDYTPSNGFKGIDTFIYVANDGLQDSDPATVTIKVDNAPKAGSDEYITPINSPLIVP